MSSDHFLIPASTPYTIALLSKKPARGLIVAALGGSGLIGKKLVNRLRERGHEAVAASPSLGVAVTGAGLADVLVGANVVVDVTNSPSFEDAAVLEFFEKSSRNLLAAEADAGVGHAATPKIVFP